MKTKMDRIYLGDPARLEERNTMKEVNQELESNSPRWDEHGWTEPDEPENTEQRESDQYPKGSAQHAIVSAIEQRDKARQIPERNATGIAYPSIEEQEDFWKQETKSVNRVT